MEIISEGAFKDAVKEGVVLVDFFANWCGPCRMLSPVLEEVESELNWLKIVKVDVDDAENLAREFGVMSIPTIILFKDGKEVKKHTGLINKEKIIDFVNE